MIIIIIIIVIIIVCRGLSVLLEISTHEDEDTALSRNVRIRLSTDAPS
jgi:hypothetical protein